MKYAVKRVEGLCCIQTSHVSKIDLEILIICSLKQIYSTITQSILQFKCNNEHVMKQLYLVETYAL